MDGAYIFPHQCLCNSLHLEPDWLCALSLQPRVAFSPVLLLEYWSASVSTGFVLTWGSIRAEVTREATLSGRRSASETLRDAQHPQGMTSQWEKKTKREDRKEEEWWWSRGWKDCYRKMWQKQMDRDLLETLLYTIIHGSPLAFKHK